MLDVWDWLALALLVVCAAHVGVLIALLHHSHPAFDLVQSWIDASPVSPNRHLPFAYASAELAPPGYLLTRQVNVLLVPLLAYYLAFRIRADFIGREPIGGLDLLFGAASIALLPLLIAVANHPLQLGAAAVLGERMAGALHTFMARDSAGAAAYFVGCVILANGITYLPAYAVARPLRRVKRWHRGRRRQSQAGYERGALARARWIGEIENDANARALIRDASDTATLEESAEEFLRSLPLLTGVPNSLVFDVVEQLAEEPRLRSTTARSWPVDAPYGHAVVAFLGAIAEQSITLAQVDEARPGEKVSFVARIASSPSSWEGVLRLDLAGSGWRYRVDATVVFAGQLFAWGRGRRILSKLERDMEAYLTELAERRA